MNTPSAWHELPNAPPAGTVLGWVDRVEDGQALMHTVYREADSAQSQPFGVLLLRSGTQVKAFANRCAHFGVPLAARQELLKFQPHISITCNVHYARYRWSDGVCDRGDCEGESLIPIPVAQDANGCIRIA
jgi:nitrite reductase/ring-hydroxylating ferredoxin subunit